MKETWLFGKLGGAEGDDEKEKERERILDADVKAVREGLEGLREKI
jgi:hypothetical protein